MSNQVDLASLLANNKYLLILSRSARRHRSALWTLCEAEARAPSRDRLLPQLFARPSGEPFAKLRMASTLRRSHLKF